MTTGVLPLGRGTFDVPFAEETLKAMLARLDATGRDFVGPRTLLLDAEAAHAGLADVLAAGAERLLILQVTFTDASFVVEAAAEGRPLSVWAPPEPRNGGRLRLNAFCGLNLASHALGRAGCAFAWAYGAPEALSMEELDTLLDGAGATNAPMATSTETTEAGRRIAEDIVGRRIARIGEHPPGFDTCAYDARALRELAGIDVEPIELSSLFEDARMAPDALVETARGQAQEDLVELEAVNQRELDRSLRLKAALDGLRTKGDFDAFAIRCWPETFTEYGGAVCGPVSMLSEERTPCACEADVYGAFTQMILQEASGEPVFLTDLVDIDTEDDSAVIWHCGQAPVSMRDPKHSATATIHTNRKMPLLYQFALKPGRVTLVRISQAFNQPKMILSGGEMLERPMSYTGTSGVLRFDRPACAVLHDVISSGLEHHMAVAYGDHRALLRSVAGALNLPLLEL